MTQGRCTDLLHGWFAEALEFEPVETPRLVLSLDVDGVLEDDREGFSSTNLAGAAALRLLGLGGVAVLLNTARCLGDVRSRVKHFKLLGGIGGFGASVWDGVYGREYCLLSDLGAAQIDRLRATCRLDAANLIDTSYACSLRVSQMVDGRLRPIIGEQARRLLDRGGLSDLTFWVAPRHTDFVDRKVDKGRGIEQLSRELGLSRLPLAAMGDAACDLPMLKMAEFAFLPAATLPSYVAPGRQRLMRSRHLGGQSLWEAACQLVPSSTLQRRVLSRVQELQLPDWMPEGLRTPPPLNRGLFPRLATALTARH
ncbi:MAG: HAD hydrolase family protein [Candidatus Dormibacteraeota bacterium]|nr:HAD hydrolase family protein [Candidatus Dormibacteraeota bacterium]